MFFPEGRATMFQTFQTGREIFLVLGFLYRKHAEMNGVKYSLTLICS
jgi:hypothetical protein